MYSADITCLVLEAFPHYNCTAQEGGKFRRFVAGLDPASQAKIHEQGATDIDEAFIVACRCERAHAAMQLHVGSTQVPQTQTQVAMVQSDHNDGEITQGSGTVTLTVQELKNDVRQLQDKNAYLTECLECWERNRITLVKEQPRITAALLQHTTVRNIRVRPYNSPGGAPHTQNRRYHTDDYRRPRSPSPVRQWSRDGSSQSRRSVHFRSPDSQQSFKQQPGKLPLADVEGQISASASCPHTDFTVFNTNDEHTQHHSKVSANVLAIVEGVEASALVDTGSTISIVG